MKKILFTVLIFLPLFAICQITSVTTRSVRYDIDKTIFDTYIDKLNLQADISGSFTLSGSNITQWRDQSLSVNHANSPTFHPTYVGGEVIFGSTQFLDLVSSINLSTFSLYLVIKQPSITSQNVPIGSSSEATYLFENNNLNNYGNTKMSIANGVGGSVAYLIGEYAYYQVWSIRRNNSVINTQCGDRNLPQYTVSNFTTDPFKFSRIGGQVGSYSNNLKLKAVCISSTYLNDSQNLNIVSYLINRYNIYPQLTQSIIGFGDSITQVYTWLSQLGTNMGLPVKNAGIAGTLLSSGALSGISRWSTDACTRPYNDYVGIMYGTNDVTHSVSVSTFQANLITVVSGLINLGYNPRNIFVFSTPYQKAGANASILTSYSTAIQNVCTTYNVKFIDILTPFRNYPGGGDLLMFDGLHPNSTGDALIAATAQSIVLSP